MAHGFIRKVPDVVACKVCGCRSTVFGVVDFNKNCELPLTALSGIPIHYHRCTVCELIFTIAFDRLSTQEFSRYVYNDQYVKFDPEYVEARPLRLADRFVRALKDHKTCRLLDYGCGSGLLVRTMRDAGFANARGVDPFVAEFSIKPAEKFDAVTAIEVVEHSPTPLETFREMAGYRDDYGLIWFMTLVQPEDIMSVKTNWWYLAPRNGHVTLYSRNSLTKIAEKLGMRYSWAEDTLHCFHGPQISPCAAAIAR